MEMILEAIGCARWTLRAERMSRLGEAEAMMTAASPARLFSATPVMRTDLVLVEIQIEISIEKARYPFSP